MQPTTHRHGRTHGPRGGFDPEFVKRAIAWRCWIEKRQVHVELRNRCGHKFPGEIPSRSFHVMVEFGAPHEPVHELLRRPHKGEDRRDNRLLPDEVRTLHFDLPVGVDAAEVHLLFKPLPLMPVTEAFRIGRWSSRAP
jgi:hypothetical protein